MVLETLALQKNRSRMEQLSLGSGCGTGYSILELYFGSLCSRIIHLMEFLGLSGLFGLLLLSGFSGFFGLSGLSGPSGP